MRLSIKMEAVVLTDRRRTFPTSMLERRPYKECAPGTLVFVNVRGLGLHCFVRVEHQVSEADDEPVPALLSLDSNPAAWTLGDLWIPQGSIERVLAVQGASVEISVDLQAPTPQSVGFEEAIGLIGLDDEGFRIFGAHRPNRYIDRFFSADVVTWKETRRNDVGRLQYFDSWSLRLRLGENTWTILEHGARK